MVITSLFYPALAIYTSSQPRYIAHYSSRILDSFLATSGVSAQYAQQDLRSPWAGYGALRVREDGLARARCGREQTLRIERLLIHGASTEETGALTRALLRSTLALEQRISIRVTERRLPCLKTSRDECLAFSPWAFWDHDERMLEADANMAWIAGKGRNVSVSGVLVTPDMVLAGRDEEDDSIDGTFASFLALTYVFKESDCSEDAGHLAWLDLLHDIATPATDFIAAPQEHALIALEVFGLSWLLKTCTNICYSMIRLARLNVEVSPPSQSSSTWHIYCSLSGSRARLNGWRPSIPGWASRSLAS